MYLPILCIECMLTLEVILVWKHYISLLTFIYWPGIAGNIAAYNIYVHLVDVFLFIVYFFYCVLLSENLNDRILHPDS